MKNDLKLTLRVSAQDMALLKRHTSVARLSQSAYVRSLIRGRVPKAYPPEPFFEAIPLMREIGGTMTVIADAAQKYGDMNVQEYRTMSNRLFAKILAIESAVTEPEYIDG